MQFYDAFPPRFNELVKLIKFSDEMYVVTQRFASRLGISELWFGFKESHFVQYLAIGTQMVSLVNKTQLF